MPVLPVRNLAALEVTVVHRLMRRLFRDRHTPHLAITHIVRFNNLKERAVWFGGKVAHFWHCFTLVVLVWFGFPGTLVWSCVASTNDLRLTPRACTGFNYMSSVWLRRTPHAPAPLYLLVRSAESLALCAGLLVVFRETSERAIDLRWAMLAAAATVLRIALFCVVGMYSTWIKFVAEEKAIVRSATARSVAWSAAPNTRCPTESRVGQARQGRKSDRRCTGGREGGHMMITLGMCSLC